MKISKPLYLCDREKCENCSYPQCKLTMDVLHHKKVEEFEGNDLIQVLESAAEAVLEGEQPAEKVASTILAARNSIIWWSYYYDRDNVNRKIKEKKDV